MIQDEVYIFLYNQHIKGTKVPDITKSNSHSKEVELQRRT